MNIITTSFLKKEDKMTADNDTKDDKDICYISNIDKTVMMAVMQMKMCLILK